MHAHPATRSRSRARHRLSLAFQAPASRTLRLFCPTLSRLLQTKTEEPQIRAASARLVRAGAPGGRLRRNVCCLAHIALSMATPLSWLASVAEARIHRRVDAGTRRSETKEQAAHQSRATVCIERNTARTLSSQTRALRL